MKTVNKIKIKMKIKLMSFFISINYFRMIGTGRVNKNLKKNGNKRETCF